MVERIGGPVRAAEGVQAHAGLMDVSGDERVLEVRVARDHQPLRGADQLLRGLRLEAELIVVDAEEVRGREADDRPPALVIGALVGSVQLVPEHQVHVGEPILGQGELHLYWSHDSSALGVECAERSCHGCARTIEVTTSLMSPQPSFQLMVVIAMFMACRRR